MSVPAPRPPDGRDRGFSILELLVTISLLLVVSGAILATYVSVQRTEAYADDRTRALDDLRRSMALVTRDLRQATTVTNASASHVEVDTYVLGSAKHVTLDVTGGVLTRTEGSATRVLQSNLLSAAVFGYEPSAAAAEIITVTLTAKPPMAPDGTVTVSSEVSLRNRGS